MGACGGEVGGAVPGDARLDDDPAPARLRRRQSIKRAFGAGELGDGAPREGVGPAGLGCALSRDRLHDPDREPTLFPAVGLRLSKLEVEVGI
jgi:hypothetical protein